MQSEDDVAEIVQRKIRRTVGRRAMQEIRQLIDRWQAEEEAGKRLWRATLWFVLATLIGVYAWVSAHPQETYIVSGNDLSRQAKTTRQ